MNKINGEGTKFMTISITLDQQHTKYLKEMNEYIKNLSDSPQAKEEALKALERTGVATKKGNLKKKIVSWE